MWDRVGFDVRFGLRQIARERGFSASVVTVLALIVGVTTGLASLMNALVLRPLPVKDPASLVVITSLDERSRQSRPIYYQTFAELARLPVFEALSLYSGGGILLTEARGVMGEGGIEAATPDLFPILGLTPALGRFFTAADAPADGPAASVTVITHHFWQRYYAGDPNAIGDRLLVNAVPLTVIGVTGPDYRGLSVDTGTDFLVPAGVLGRQLATNQFTADHSRPLRGLHVVGRLRPGVPLQQARAALRAAWPQLRTDTVPAGLGVDEQRELRTRAIEVESLSTGFSNLRTRYGDPLAILLGGSVLLLLVGCGNLSGLLLTRAMAHHQALSIRLALGATRARVVQQRLVHGLLLSILGTAVAVPIAWWVSVSLLAVISSGTMPLVVSVAPDARVFALLAGGATFVGLIVSVLPSMLAARAGTQGLLGTRLVSAANGKWGRALLIAEVALSLALLFGAGLFVRSLGSLRGLDAGVRVEGVRWTRVFAQPGGYRTIDDASYYPALVQQLSAMPGVTSVALSHHFPAYFNFGPLVALHTIARSADGDRGPAVTGMMEYISPEFFETNGIALHEGRDVIWSDDRQHPAVAVINEALRRRLFGDGEAVGQRIRIGEDSARRAVEVIGVVADATMGDYRATHQPVAFRPKLQEPRFTRTPVITIRTSVDAVGIDAAISKVVYGMGHEYVRRVYTMEEQFNITLKQERLLAALSSAFAGFALLLAAVGVYSVLAYSVVCRTREIGLRMALGATRDRMLWVVARESLLVIAAGIVIGAPVALLLARLVGTMLFGLSAFDPWTMAGAAAVLVVVGVAAGLLPAIAASNVDPASALRTE